jgi:poly(3-hydroxybutyrate) depolymerase
MEFHGGNDTVIKIDGGPRRNECLPAVRHWVEIWAGKDGLDTKKPAKSPIGSDNAEVFKYGSGKEKGLVTFVYDGDHVNHDWPATIVNQDQGAHGSAPASFNASSMIMDFFRANTLP